MGLGPVRDPSARAYDHYGALKVWPKLTQQLHCSGSVELWGGFQQAQDRDNSSTFSGGGG